jgi:transposase
VLSAGGNRPETTGPGVCREHNLSESVLLRWRKEYDARGEEAAFAEKQLSQTEALQKKIAELERFCGKLALENEILKKGLARYRSGGGTLWSHSSKRSIPGCRWWACASCSG